MVSRSKSKVADTLILELVRRQIEQVRAEHERGEIIINGCHNRKQILLSTYRMIVQMRIDYAAAYN